MNKNDVIGKSVCLVLMSKDKRGKDDWAVVSGEIVFHNGEPCFQNSETDGPFPLPEDIVERLRAPDDDIRDIVFNSDYYVCLSVGPKPKRQSADKYLRTGLKWPKKSKKTAS